MGPTTADDVPIQVGHSYWQLGLDDFGGGPVHFLRAFRVQRIEDNRVVGYPGTYPPGMDPQDLWDDFDAAHRHYLETLDEGQYVPYRNLTIDGQEPIIEGRAYWWEDRSGSAVVFQTIRVESVSADGQAVSEGQMTASVADLWALPRYADTGEQIIPCLGYLEERDRGAAYIIADGKVAITCPSWEGDHWWFGFPGTYHEWTGKFFWNRPELN